MGCPGTAGLGLILEPGIWRLALGGTMSAWECGRDMPKLIAGDTRSQPCRAEPVNWEILCMLERA